VLSISIVQRSTSIYIVIYENEKINTSQGRIYQSVQRSQMDIRQIRGTAGLLIEPVNNRKIESFRMKAYSVAIATGRNG
jgi:hypothetical protein